MTGEKIALIYSVDAHGSSMYEVFLSNSNSLNLLLDVVLSVSSDTDLQTELQKIVNQNLTVIVLFGTDWEEEAHFPE